MLTAAPPGDATTVASSANTVAPRRAESLPWLGAKLDVGVPDGLGVSVLIRPWSFLRFEAGVLENGFAPGIRGGLAFTPVHSWVTPVLALEAGHYFAGNANGIAKKVSGNPNFSSGFLNSVQYDFGNAHLGLEFGSFRRFVFFVHSGLTRVIAHDSSFAEGLQGQAGGGWTSGPATVHANSYSAKLGFILYLG